jgi:predicted AAA+ superfamily ATPase
MQYYKRALEYKLVESLQNNKAIFILGPRQVGKTTLLKHMMNVVGKANALYYDMESTKLMNIFSGNLEDIVSMFRYDRQIENQRTYIFIDEIQYISDFSKTIKLLIDHYATEFKLILTGSSSVLIKRQFQESLAGRKEEHILYPLSFPEFCRFKNEDKIADILDHDYLHEPQNPLFRKEEQIELLLSEYMVFGGYPEVVQQKSDLAKADVLNEIVSSYILKDVRHLFHLEKPDQLNRLIRNLAINTGKEINLQKLSSEVGLHSETVKNYLMILESSYIIALVRPFFNNLNKEQRKMPKAYFLDTGIRNMLISNFTPLSNRQDRGEIFENMVFMKFVQRKNVLTEIKYWKTKAKQEIDFIVINNAVISAYEVKYGNDKFHHCSAFQNAYPAATCHIVRFNYKYIESELPGYF